MSKESFTMEKKDGAVWIVNHTATHIDGEPFKYKQGDEIDAEFLCKELNELFDYKVCFKEIMDIIHNIKHSNWDCEDLMDYIYKGVSMDVLWNRHDDLHKTIMEMKK